MRLKQDSAHQVYLQKQQQDLLHQFSITVDAATSAAANILDSNAAIPHYALVQENDVDQDDLPSSYEMDVDHSPEDSDGEQSIISGPEVPVLNSEEEEEEIQMLAQTMDGAYHVGGLDLDDIVLQETFDFLPNPDLDMEEGEAATEPSTAASQHSPCRTLVDMEAEEPTCKWHATAGQVYGQEPIMHARWQALFNAGSDIQAYKPFNSRLDWEMAQWAVKEKISQKSSNRLLAIPQVDLVFATESGC